MEDNSPNNVYLSLNRIITIIDSLNTTDLIGISTQSTPALKAPIDVATSGIGYSGGITSNDAAKFASDNGSYATKYDSANKKVQLVVVITDSDAVAGAKSALINGSVNVAFGADQTAKTAAVKAYVESILSGTAYGDLVTATVSYNSSTGNYDVDLTKGSVNDSKSLNMTVNIEPDPDIAVVNSAKLAAEGASYLGMSQLASTSETIIEDAQKTIATTAVNNTDVTIFINKISYTEPIAGTSANPEGTNGSYLFTVTLSKGSVTVTTETLTITITSTPSKVEQFSGGGGSSTKPVTQPISGADILVNGSVVSAGTSVDTKVEGKTVTTVTIDQDKLEQKLKTEGKNSIVTIPVITGADIIVGELNGQMVKNMENKESAIEIKTDRASYTLPAQQINIDAVSKTLGFDVELKDIKVYIEIAKPADKIAKIVEDSAKASEFTIVAPAVDFNIRCSYKGKTIETTKFNAYPMC